jgi:hypothetical protein
LQVISRRVWELLVSPGLASKAHLNIKKGNSKRRDGEQKELGNKRFK